MSKLLEVRNLSKDYGKSRVLNTISFSCDFNQCVGIIGHNGAGKTTLLEIIMGVRKQTEGEVLWDSKLCENLKYYIGAQIQELALFPKIKVMESIDLFANIYNVSDERKEEIISSFELSKVRKKYVSKLSSGWKNRLSLSLALLHNPDVIFLDEPTTGLDIEAAQYLWEIIEGLKKEKKSIFISTHNMEEIEKYCDKVIILKNGKLQKFDYISNIKSELGEDTSMEDVYMYYCSNKGGKYEN